MIKKEKIPLKSKSILLGISGGVAAYKSIDLIRRLKDEGASVSVIMTEAAKRFVTPLSLEVASENKVYSSLFDEPMAHLKLPINADVMVIAPATANIISKFAHGLADDLLSTSLLVFKGRVIIAPSMNWRMYENPIFRKNLRTLALSGVIQTGPEKGSLACGEEGIGRMADISQIIEAVKEALSEKDLKGERIVITAGPTREYIDPVRYISNRSSGKMGFSLARAAKRRGAEVTLISGPTALMKPYGMDFVQVETSEEMMKAVKTRGRNAAVLIMAAAVADFTPLNKSKSKTEKNRKLSLELQKTRDIISEISKTEKRPFIIGFAAETGKNIEKAIRKMVDKGMDMVVFNDVTEPGSGFEVDTNNVVIIDKKERISTGLMSKDSVADSILDRYLKIKA